MSVTLPSVGIHAGVPFEEYRQWPAVNISTLKPMAKSAKHCRWAADHPKESDELNVGSALHVKCFEPSRFDKEFYVCPDIFDGRTKEGKAVAAKAVELANGRKVLWTKEKDYRVDADSVTGMADSLWNHGAASRFLKLPGQCEVSALWQDQVTGLMCKGRFDKYVPAESSPLKRPVLVELKSTGDGRAETDNFGREIAKWRYAAQAAFYLWGLEQATGQSAVHVFLVVENVPPYAANWGTLDDPSLQTGAVQFRNWLTTYHQCVKSGKWPGYPELPAPVFAMPPWANREVIEEF